MVVNPDMVSVSGVVLKPPKIVYGGNDRPMVSHSYLVTGMGICICDIQCHRNSIRMRERGTSSGNGSSALGNDLRNGQSLTSTRRADPMSIVS